MKGRMVDLKMIIFFLVPMEFNVPPSDLCAGPYTNQMRCPHSDGEEFNFFSVTKCNLTARIPCVKWGSKKGCHCDQKLKRTSPQKCVLDSKRKRCRLAWDSCVTRQIVYTGERPKIHCERENGSPPSLKKLCIFKIKTSFGFNYVPSNSRRAILMGSGSEEINTYLKMSKYFHERIEDNLEDWFSSNSLQIERLPLFEKETVDEAFFVTRMKLIIPVVNTNMPFEVFKDAACFADFYLAKKGPGGKIMTHMKGFFERKHDYYEGEEDTCPTINLVLNLVFEGTIDSFILVQALICARLILRYTGMIQFPFSMTETTRWIVDCDLFRFRHSLQGVFYNQNRRTIFDVLVHSPLITFEQSLDFDCHDVESFRLLLYPLNFWEPEFYRAKLYPRLYLEILFCFKIVYCWHGDDLARELAKVEEMLSRRDKSWNIKRKCKHVNLEISYPCKAFS
jgi:hypothetical protein